MNPHPNTHGYRPLSLNEEEDPSSPLPVPANFCGDDDDSLLVTSPLTSPCPVDDVRHQSLWNFICMSILFSANHGCVVACLALATSRLGSVGAWQSGLLYLFYTLSSIFGSTYIVKLLGARNALVCGMTLYVAYVGCFVVALQVPPQWKRMAAYTGAGIGGLGAGFLWVAQGAYFSQAAEDHALVNQQPLSTSTATLAGYFAFWYLALEVILRLVSTVLLEWPSSIGGDGGGGFSWNFIFGLYTSITVASAAAMLGIHDFPRSNENQNQNQNRNGIENNNYSNNSHNNNNEDDGISEIWIKATAAGRLLKDDPKMKYMIGLNAVYGFASAFLNSYVNAEVIPLALNDPNSKFVGVLTAWASALAALLSLLFGCLAPKTGKGPILICGAICFMGVVLPFCILPDAKKYGWVSLIIIYSLMGTGRATFEGTLKARFADFFAYEKEGAFANVILQNGLSGAIGYALSFSLQCNHTSRYCIQYRDGSRHYVLVYEILVIVCAFFAVTGYLRASYLFRKEKEQESSVETTSNSRGVEQDNDSSC